MSESPAPFMPALVRAHTILTPEIEAEQRRAVIAEALSWNNTPYRDQGNVKGGAVDCAMVLVNSWVNAGVVEAFDPRPYPPSWYLHHDQERYLEWLTVVAEEVPMWRPADLVIWKFGRCFSHTGIVINEHGHVLHALKDFGKCTVTDMNEAFLEWDDKARPPGPRPRKFFDVWARIREAA